MKISFFIGSMMSGGAEKVISLLANEYAQNGWNVDIVLLLKNEVNRKQFDLNPKIQIINLSMKNGSYKKNAIKWLFSIRKYIKKRRPDCVISFIGRINALVLTATLGIDIPILVSERNDPKHDGRSKIMQWYCNQIYAQATAIVYQTNYEKECFNRKLDSKSYIIPNPVEINKSNAFDENEFEISAAGRLVEQKNYSLLIKAVSLVRGKYPEVRWYIYGDGALKQELKQQIFQLGLENNVFLPGNKKDVNKWVSKSSIFVMSSNYEGLSNALIEAMMQGKACISTDYPGANELIDNGKNGIIVPIGNYKELANSIITLFENKDIRQKLGKEAMVDSIKFKKENVIGQWKCVISKIIKEKETK